MIRARPNSNLGSLTLTINYRTFHTHRTLEETKVDISIVVKNPVITCRIHSWIFKKSIFARRKGCVILNIIKIICLKLTSRHIIHREKRICIEVTCEAKTLITIDLLSQFYWPQPDLELKKNQQFNCCKGATA